MYLKRIRLKNFRNIQQAYIEFSTGVTVLNGDNGQGKTNLIEAIYLPSRGRSFRTKNEEDLMKFGEDYTEIELNYSDERDNCVVFKLYKYGKSVKKSVFKNKIQVSLSELIGGFRAVLFSPENLSLIKDGPAERRKFLDIAISQIDLSYLKSRQKYLKILEQRNALIKDARDKRNDSIFFDNAEIWSEQLAAEAEIIAEKRFVYTEKMSDILNEIVLDMTGKRENIKAVYRTPRKKDEYFKQLCENMPYELKNGATMYGIHRDEIEVTMNDLDARLYCSQGQQRTIALGMKLSEGELNCINGSYPVYLLDDVFSELDEKRIKFILDGISGRQVIISSCDKIATEARIVRVENGRFF